MSAPMALPIAPPKALAAMLAQSQCLRRHLARGIARSGTENCSCNWTPLLQGPRRVVRDDDRDDDDDDRRDDPETLVVVPRRWRRIWQGRRGVADQLARVVDLEGRGVVVDVGNDIGNDQ